MIIGNHLKNLSFINIERTLKSNVKTYNSLSKLCYATFQILWLILYLSHWPITEANDHVIDPHVTNLEHVHSEISLAIGWLDSFSGTKGIKPILTNHFLVVLKQSCSDPNSIARNYSMTNLGQISGHPHHYNFKSLSITKTPKEIVSLSTNKGKRRSRRQSKLQIDDLHRWQNLKYDPQVHYVVRQPGFIRTKRGYKALELKLPQPNSIKEPNDPLFGDQWYLKNTGQNGGKKYLDLNVEAAWAMGVTGKNVTTAIMDDGIDYTHPDLRENFNAKASYDFSSNDPYPYPRYTDDWFNSHGTRCAGEVSAKRDNGICGVGIAYDSKVAGIRMLDQPYMTDLIEANSMGHEPNLIDIYSASWGPTDDGKTVDGPRNLTMRAIVKGVNEGRNGLGNIYVWASGDGGKNDDCNCDGYAASMWTISINSAINTGENARYDESCSSTLASTFSNGGKNPNSGVATTDLYAKCTKTHSGTSAAAPEAAGVFALALEANPFLTWRDIQHLTVFTSKRNSLYDSQGEFPWTRNGVGLEFNHLFGYGILDAGAMVALAKTWKPVPLRFHCEAGVFKDIRQIPSHGSLTLHIDTDSCRGKQNEVNFLEHVQCVITLNSTRRGDVTIYLISPSGTRSMLLSRRPFDDDFKDGFYKWPFMTTHTWGENPKGRWTMEVKFKGDEIQSGHLKQWTLLLHGTKSSPYEHQIISDPKSKLAIAKKAHDLQL
ncbi:unnamed protein product [Gordionus sp. m RMFG-2023]|uniref:neuroendocrine convertase 2-like n=1 Tax=Gordionus sp. m RMFG-2023 TaxID=3053472 RepID=UPI0030DFB8F9